MKQRYFIAALLLCAITVISWHILHRTTKTVDDSLLIVGTNTEFPPFAFYKDGMVVGFEIDIVHEIANCLGKTIIFKDMPFHALLPAIQLGQIHIIAAGLNPTPERARQALFTKPTYKGDPLVIINMKQNGKPATSINDLSGKKIIVNEGYFADTFISSQPGITNVLRISSALISESLLGLQSGRADYLIASYATIIPFLTEQQKEVLSITILNDIKEESALVVAKQYPELYTSVNNCLAELEKNGRLKDIQNKWFTEGVSL